MEYDPEDEGTFWVSLDEYMSKFDSLVTCRTFEWSEIRVKGKFIRVKESEGSDREKVMTKFFYKLHVSETTNVFITMHQDDEKVFGGDRRKNIDMACFVLKYEGDEELDLVGYFDHEICRQKHIELELEPGTYVIMPHTSGGLIGRPHDADPDELGDMFIDDGGLQVVNPLHKSMLKDMFRKVDLVLNRQLDADEC